MGHHKRVTIFEKCHVFTILSLKIVFEETQKTCSLLMKSTVFISCLVCIL